LAFDEPTPPFSLFFLLFPLCMLGSVGPFFRFGRVHGSSRVFYSLWRRIPPPPVLFLSFMLYPLPGVPLFCAGCQGDSFPLSPFLSLYSPPRAHFDSIRTELPCVFFLATPREKLFFPPHSSSRDSGWRAAELFSSPLSKMMHLFPPPPLYFFFFFRFFFFCDGDNNSGLFSGRGRRIVFMVFPSFLPSPYRPPVGGRASCGFFFQWFIVSLMRCWWSFFFRLDPSWLSFLFFERIFAPSPFCARQEQAL